MEEEKLWWIVEFALHDVDLPHALLIALIQSLPFPSNPNPPSHIRRLFLLRHLLSACVSHRLLSPLTFKTLERLLPPPTSPPSPSLCSAYASHLFYLSMHPGFSVEVATVLSRLGNYCFAMKLLEPWRAMIARQEKIRSSPADRVVSARDKAIFALRDFVDEEIRALGPPFILRGVQELCTENQNVMSLAQSEKSDKGASQKETEAIPRETSSLKTGTKQVDGACTPSRRSDRVAAENETQANGRETLLSKTGAKQVDSYHAPNEKSNKGATPKETQANQKEISPTETGAKQADGTCTSASSQTTVNGTASAKQNNVYEENQENPTKFCGIDSDRKQDRSKKNGKENVRNANDASTSHANHTDVDMNKNNGGSHVPARHFMDRNATAHVLEWDDSIDQFLEMEKAQSCMTSRINRQVVDQNGRIPKRRRAVKWQPDEEEALRKAVKEIGKGNWTEILNAYRDEFAGRTAVDLKDKWRNMTRY